MTGAGNGGRGCPGREQGGAPFAETQAPLPAAIAASGSSLNNSHRRTAYHSGSIPLFSRFVPARFRVFRKSGTTGLLRALLYQFSHGGDSGGGRAFSEGEPGVLPHVHG